MNASTRFPGNVIPYPDEFVRRYQVDGFWREETIPQSLRRTAEQAPEALALVTPDVRWTYRELIRRADNVAAGLLRSGLEPGDAVILQLTNTAHAVSAWYGLLRAGLIPVCTLSLHRGHEIRQIAAKTGARGHLVQADMPNFDMITFAGEIREELPHVEILLTVGAIQGSPGVRIEDLEDQPLSLTDLERLDAIEASSNLDAPAVFQLSGGTTGTPKVIPRLHPEYWYNGAATAKWWNLGSSDRLAFGLPLAHNAAIANALFAAHSVGAALLLATPKSDVLLKLMAQEGATWLMSPPGVMRDYLSHPLFDEAFADVKTCVLTAAPVHRALFDEMQQRGVHVSQAFGMTEGLFLFTPLNSSDDLRAETVGVPISPLDEVRLLEPGNDRQVADGETGELCVRGPYTIRGYFAEPERNAVAFTQDGFYRTGDLAALVRIKDEDAYVICGRTKDLINRGGEKINAEEIESLLIRHDSVAEAALVAMPDERLGEKACAFVALQEGATTPSLSDLCAFLAQNGVAKFKWPERLEIVPSLPRTTIGKVQKLQLREQLAAKANFAGSVD
ncbi:AMP-binding protein [Pseudarthrobacter raffinosi]|uniref:AMP-binding protein n=1 Tax=Pseudarthrobacter raffinosi TaxID=2953651 RepID=UPI00208E5B00|nr:AMP-binding protein [Pseudarthrobacter sp. MDT3-9]MCO4251241.1 AMP-binding protein [Pseudarthrobacter sp. MDT3-9]